jgi:hypothetical protein
MVKARREDHKAFHRTYSRATGKPYLVRVKKMQIVVKDNIKEITKNLDRKYRRQIPFAASQALNDVAKAARLENNKQTKTVFEGGAVGHTTRSFKYKTTNKRELAAAVFIDPKTHKYMEFMVEGGTRFPNNKAILTSTYKSKLNRYGNFTKATMSHMLDDKKKHFKGIPKGMPHAGEGIWERYGRSKNYPSGRRIRKVGAYIDQAQYRPVFPFGKFTEGVVFSREKGFGQAFRERLANAIRTAK